MKAAIAAGHDLTAQAGMDVLKAGGNAFDGVLAAMLMSCVSEPVLASLGGGGYLMARDGKTGKITFYDFFVQTPLQKRKPDQIEFYGAHADFGSVRQEFHIGAGAAAVPGIIPGFFALQKALCKLTKAQIIAPAFQAASEGVKVSPFQAYLFSVISPIITAHEDVRGHFLQSGALPQAGDLFQMDGMAGLLKQMAEGGSHFHQNGSCAQDIIAQSQAHGGHLTQKDFDLYQVNKHEPLQIPFLGYQVYLPPPPAAGGCLIAFGLLLIDKLVKERAIKSPDLVALVQVMEQSNAIRDQPSDIFLDQDTVLKSLQKIEGKPIARKGTTHISVIDEAMNIAALTLTNGEGNGRLVAGHGFMLNNMLGEEDLHPKGFHQWEEGQRLSSMMAPTLIKTPDDQWIALGTGGSNRIRTAILQVIVNIVSRQMPLQQAIDTARLHAEKCGTVSFEQAAAIETFSKQELEALAKAYPDIHNWTERNLFFGGVHAVSGGKDQAFSAAADGRRSGCALVSNEES